MKKLFLTFGSLIAYASIASAQSIPVQQQIPSPVAKPQPMIQQQMLSPVAQQAPVVQAQPMIAQQPMYQPQPIAYQQPVMMQAPTQPAVQPIIIQAPAPQAPVIIQQSPMMQQQAPMIQPQAPMMQPLETAENVTEKKEGVYFGFSLRGVSADSHAKLVDNNWGGSWVMSEEDMELETGGGISLALGYEVGNARIELAYTSDMNYEKNDISSSTELLQSELYASTIGVNIYYGFNSTGKVSPYIGLGFGQTQIEYKSYETGFEGAWDDSILTYQGMAGLDFHLSNTTTLNIGYTYKKSAENALLKGVMDDGWGNKLDMELDYVAHIGEVGLRFRF